MSLISSLTRRFCSQLSSSTLPLFLGHRSRSRSLGEDLIALESLFRGCCSFSVDSFCCICANRSHLEQETKHNVLVAQKADYPFSQYRSAM